MLSSLPVGTSRAALSVVDRQGRAHGAVVGARWRAWLSALADRLLPPDPPDPIPVLAALITVTLGIGLALLIGASR